MRLARLDLTRYGRFTNRVIDLGDRPASGPDLHLIYGPNEAGKSTALAAFLDLLYRIGNHYNFLHDYDAMRIGACLEFDGRRHEFIRVKRNRNDLLDGNELPVSEAIIAGQLGGIDRQAYRAMFSLDDETLEAGGESILASKGDLGQLLFSASTGLADLSRTLTDLRMEADGYYRFHARSGELQSLKTRLTELKTKREEIDTIASHYAQLVTTRDRVQARYDEAIAGRAAIQARMNEVQGHINALPRLAALRDARARLLPLGDSPSPPAGWPEMLRELQKAESELAVRLETIENEIARKTAELETIVVDEDALAIADRVERLAPLHARYVTAEADIPDRERTVRELNLDVAGILARIGRDGNAEPQDFLLDAATVGRLNDLIATRSGIETELHAATRELTAAGDALETALAMVREADATTGTQGQRQRDDAALATLAAVVATLHGGDHTARRRTAERTRDRHEEALTEQLRLLRPGLGDIDLLAAAAVPGPGDISRWKAALAKAHADNELRRDEAERLTSERLRLQAEHAAIARTVNDQDAGAIRAAREAAWANHRRTLDSDSADIFEAALRRDDLIVDARLSQQSNLAKLHESSLSFARAEAAADRATELRDTATRTLAGIQDEIATAVAPFLPAGASVEQFEAWLKQRDKALEINADLRRVVRDLRDIETDIADARQRLIAAMDAAGMRSDATASMDVLLAMARAMLDRETQLKGLRAAVDQCRRELKSRERNHAAAIQRDQAWSEAWQTVCSSCWLGKTGTSPPLAAVREILPEVENLRHALDKRIGLNERIIAMQADQEAFTNAVNAIASETGIANDRPLVLERMLTERVQAAGAARTSRSAKTQELEWAQEQRDQLTAARAIHTRRKTEMTEFFGVGTLTEVAEKLADADKKAALQKQAEDATREILDMLRLPSIDVAEGVLDNTDRATLEAELVELQARFADQDQRSRELFSAHSKAVDQIEAVGGDAAVAKLEEQRQTTLLEIEDGARRYLRLRLGIVAAEHALRTYRQQHRSSMMSLASAAFRTISRGAYTDLASQANRDKEDLIAIGADGSSKIASALSKGTRFQLYLALRVAGYHEFARMRPPVPFIADDIMETFDDFRAEEAIRLLADMGEVGQVIYLTHHRHLCEIAQRVCPGVRVHELSVDFSPAR